MIWGAKNPSRGFLMLWWQFILLMKHGYLSTVFLLLKDILLHWCFHHSPPSPPLGKDSICMSRTTARWFGDRARECSTSNCSHTDCDDFVISSDDYSSNTEADSDNAWCDPAQPPVQIRINGIWHLDTILASKPIGTEYLDIFDAAIDQCSLCPCKTE